MLKNITNSTFALALVFSLMGLSNTAVAQTSSAAQIISYGFPHTIQSPCNGHIIDLDGQAHVTLKSMPFQGNKTLVIQNVNFSGIKGVSRDNGDKYN